MYVRELKVDSNGKTRLQWRKKNESIYSGYIYIYISGPKNETSKNS